MSDVRLPVKLYRSVKPDYKSEEIPTGDDAKDGDVVVVVGKTFDDIVLDDSKDVFLEAYAPWCGHCKQLAPAYRKLAKRFRDVDSVVIAKVGGHPACNRCSAGCACDLLLL